MPIPGVRVTDAEVFPYLNLILPAWILLAFFPRWSKTQPIVTFFALAFSVLFVVLSVPVFFFGQGNVRFSDFSSLEGVQRALCSPDIVLAAWDHYIVFDLWTGKWMVSDAIERGVPHLLVVPCLFLTINQGPSGFLLYFIMRTLFSRRAVKRD